MEILGRTAGGVFGVVVGVGAVVGVEKMEGRWGVRVRNVLRRGWGVLVWG